MQKLSENEAEADFVERTSTSEDEDLVSPPKLVTGLKHGDVITVDGEKKQIIFRQGVLMAFPLLHEDEKEEEWDEIPVPVVRTKQNNKSMKELLSTLSQNIKNRTIVNDAKIEKW